MTYRLPYRKPIESIPYDEFYSALEPNHAPDGTFSGVAVGDGWYRLVMDLNQELTEKYPNYSISQVKEKFGDLRYYTQGLDEEGEKMVSLAARDATKTCERCSRAGDLRYANFYEVLCWWDAIATVVNNARDRSFNRKKAKARERAKNAS
jgi:hypothetical protein